MRSSDIVIRPARPEDAPRFYELHIASVRALCSSHYSAEVIGTGILRHAVGLARREHDGPVRLEATLNARDFYERAGFREVKRSTVKRNPVDVPVVVMELDAG